MVRCVVQSGWPVAATAERFRLDPKTVRKWVARYRAEGPAGLGDRSSRPRSCPWATSLAKRSLVLELREQRRYGAPRIAHQVGLSISTVQSILTSAGVGLLSRGDRVQPAEPARRYQRDRPGELIHVDIKKLAGIPDGGGWRLHGRHTSRKSGVGYRYLHSALDDRTRIAYTEMLSDEQATTAAGFLRRALTFFAEQGIAVQRVLTDNGPCYRSGHWHRACAAAGVTAKKTRSRRPQTNGKVERYHRILLEEWAYARAWTSESQRRATLAGFCHFYNQHRPHGGLAWLTPQAALTQLAGDNLPGIHS
jgi:transposase InsO family protein